MILLQSLYVLGLISSIQGRTFNISWSLQGVENYTSDPLRTELGDKLRLTCNKTSNLFIQTDIIQYDNCNASAGSGLFVFNGFCLAGGEIFVTLTENTQSLMNTVNFQNNNFYYFTSYSNGNIGDASKSSIDHGGQCTEGLKMVVLIGEDASSPALTTSPPTLPPVIPPPPFVQTYLCSIIVWHNPEVPCDVINGYSVRFFHPREEHQNVTRHLGTNGTFYVIKDEDITEINNATSVQVRVIHSTGVGEWSFGKSLGCEKPTSPPVIPNVHFEHSGKLYPNNSSIRLADIGEGEAALFCKTNKEDCCGTPPNRFGEFYYPSGIQVPIKKLQRNFYRNRGEQIVRLNRREGVTSPTGKYRCEVLDADGVSQTIYINLIE